MENSEELQTTIVAGGRRGKKKKKKKKPWRRKNVEKEHLALSNVTFLLIAIDTNGFRRIKEEGLIYKVASDFLIFAWALSYDLSKFSDDFTPFFDFERP